MVQVEIVEDRTSAGCQKKVNDFLAGLAVRQLMDVQHGRSYRPVWLAEEKPEYWCLVIYQAGSWPRAWDRRGARLAACGRPRSATRRVRCATDATAHFRNRPSRLTVSLREPPRPLGQRGRDAFYGR